MAAPNGCWNLNGNGFRGTLLLVVDANGQVQGIMYGNPIRGFWDEAAQRLMVYRTCLGTELDSVQVYTGYRFDGGMAGTFEAFATSGATPSRSVFGWYATPGDAAAMLG